VANGVIDATTSLSLAVTGPVTVEDVTNIHVIIGTNPA
jgi:hypothetical protein